MSIVFLNGNFIKSEDAKVSIFDTGFYYGDGIYEVALLCDGKLIDIDGHFERMEEVLLKVKFNNVPSIQELKRLSHEVVAQNKQVKNGMVYVQITRGVMENRYSKITSIEKPTVLIYTIPTSLEFDVTKKVIKCELIEETRRYDRSIKMTSLMPANLAKIHAYEQGYDYVLFKDRASKAVTEGVSSNIFIVSKEGMVLTHPLGNEILSGCTRKKAIEFLREEGIKVEERKFYEEDLLNAKEAFVTGAIKLFTPIEIVNGKKIGDGNFAIAKFCMEKYVEFIKTF